VQNKLQTSTLKISVVVSISIILTLIWITVVLNRARNDPKAFVVIGSVFQEHNPEGSIGYDGQFAYYIALEGLAAQPKLDVPSYRLQRILYPLIVGILSLGQTSVIPWMLILLNVVATAITVGYLAAWLIRYRRPPWYALVFAFWIGVIFTIRFDLNELTCVMLGTAGLTLVRDKRLYAATVLLGLSTLAKDMGFVFIAAAGLCLFFSSQRRIAIAMTLFSLLPYIVWAIAVRQIVAAPTMIYGGTIPSIFPLQGYANAKTSVELLLMGIWLILPALVLGTISLVYVTRCPGSLPGWFMAAAALWVLYMPAASAYDLIASFRVAMPLIPAGLIFAAELRQPRLLYVLAALWTPALILALILPGFMG
jgi:hypothetical protein